MYSITQKCWNSPYLLLVFATLFWGGNSVTGRFLAHSVPPFTLSLIRLGISAIIILPFIYPVLKKEWHLAKQHYKLILLLGVTGVIGFNLLVYWAAHFTTAVNITLLNSVTPIFMVIFAYFLLKEKMAARMFVSIMISLIGILLVMTQGSLQKLIALQFNIGDLLMLFAVLLWAIYSIYIKKTAGSLSPVSIFGYSTVVGVILLIPASMIELSFTTVGNIDIPQLIGIAYLGIFPSICSFLAWNRAVLLIGPSRSSMFTNLIPVWGVILAYLILGESITIAHCLGALFVFAGIFLSRIKELSRRSVIQEET